MGETVSKCRTQYSLNPFLYANVTTERSYLHYTIQYQYLRFEAGREVCEAQGRVGAKASVHQPVLRQPARAAAVPEGEACNSETSSDWRGDDAKYERVILDIED